MEINNKKAHFEYFISETYEAGIVLQGWEIKPLLKKKVNLEVSYVIVKNGEIFLLNAQITPNTTTDSLNKPDISRTRKLLLHKKEIMRLIGQVEQKGYTLIATKMYTKNGKFKVEIGLAKGKKNYDKRQTIKDRDWNIEQERLIKNKF